jgi:hypothetical protein
MIKLQILFNDLIDTLISLIRVISKSDLQLHFTNIEKIGNEISVLGNGPSLTKSLEQHRCFIEKRAKLVVNAFAVSEEYEKLKPEYYVLADPQFWMENALERAQEIVGQTMKSIIEKTNWKLSLILPKEARGSYLCNKILRDNKKINITYYNKVTILGFTAFRNFCYRKNIGMPRAYNVLLPGLMITLGLGYKRIYLFGADHTWHENLALDKDNTLCFRDAHFYNHETKLHPIRNIHTGESVKIHEQFYSLYQAFKSYWIIKPYADSVGAKIYNASESSFIDAFERVDLKVL